MHAVETKSEVASRENSRFAARSASELSCFLHIYKVCRSLAAGVQEDATYLSVASLGRDRRQAEQVAINQVHQRGYRILFTDTATAAPWLNQELDQPYVRALNRYGAAVQVLAA